MSRRRLPGATRAESPARPWRRLFAGAATAIAIALGGIAAPFAAQSASAADIPDAITGVNIIENSINSGVSAMRLEVSFEIGVGIGRGGSAQGGDTFWLQMDPRLSAPNGTFDVYAIGSSTDIVARVTMVGGSRATFTLTDYVNNRSFTEGAAFWGITFRDNTIAAGRYDLSFTTAVDEFTEPIVVQSRYNPGAGGITPPLISGVWQDFPQRNGTWKVILPDGPAETMVFESFGWTSGPEWEYDCARTLANANAYRYLTRSAREVSIQCTPNYLRWELATVPEYESAGLHPTLQIDFDVVDPSRSGDLVFTTSTSYTINGDTPRRLNGELRQTRGGGALGPTTPSVPTVTQSICIAGAPSDPLIVLPSNGSGVTYTKNIDDGDYHPGDTVEVIAELSTGYEWDLPLSDAWDIVSGTIAVYAIELDPAPDCVLAPVNPTVTQASCSANTVVAPDIALPAAAPGINYSTDPASYSAGDTVEVIATLNSVDYVWAGPLPAAWTLRSETVASRTIVLDAAPDCRMTVIPQSPQVEQTTCVAGDQVAPDVRLAGDTAEITYRIDGDVRAASTVRVFATLDGAGHRWGDDLPAGWVVQSDTVAVFTVRLIDPVCVTPVVPVSPTVIQGSCSSSTPVLPVVDPAVSTPGIRYSTVGSIEPGATVQVIATLAGPEFVWDSGFPAGWRVDTATTASFLAALDPADCGPDSTALADTGLHAAALPIGIAGGGLLLGGLAMVLLHSRRGPRRS